MSAWITDRVPTEGDLYDEVWATVNGRAKRVRYYHVTVIGQPWQPITYPEPYVKPKVWTLTGEIGPGPILRKNGKHVCGLNCFTPNQWHAILDALNKLEEGV